MCNLNKHFLTHCAELCRLSYKETTNDIFEYYKKSNLNIISVEKHTIHNDVLYLIEEKDINIIVIRGTDDLRDVVDWFRLSKIHINDFDINKHSGIHSGFLDRSLFIEKLLVNNKLNFINGNKPLYIIGHSLGGSIALITGTLINIKFTRKYPINIITFGSPKIFNSEMTEYLTMNMDIFNVVNKSDIITYLPYLPMWFIPGDFIKIGNSILNNISLIKLTDLLNLIKDFCLFRLFGSPDRLSNIKTNPALDELILSHKITRYKRLLLVDKNN